MRGEGLAGRLVWRGLPRPVDASCAAARGGVFFVRCFAIAVGVASLDAAACVLVVFARHQPLVPQGRRYGEAGADAGGA